MYTYIYIHIYIYIYIYIYSVTMAFTGKFVYIYYIIFTSEKIFEVAIESWPEWDLNPRSLNSVQTL